MANPDDFTADEELAADDTDDELVLDDELAIDDFAAAEAADDDEDETVAVVADPVEEVEEEDDEPDLDEETDDAVDDSETEGEESLDVLLSRDKAVEDEDLGRLEEPRDGFTVPAQPISASEFTCRSCFLVKNRAQLADEDKLVCLDCA